MTDERRFPLRTETVYDPGPSPESVGYSSQLPVTARAQALADFLLARIAEDEDAVRSSGTPLYRTETVRVRDTVLPWRYSLDATAQRLLAECEAKRRIIGRLDHFVHISGYDVEQPREDVFRLLAQPYADHPDFREDWRVA